MWNKAQRLAERLEAGFPRRERHAYIGYLRCGNLGDEAMYESIRLMAPRAHWLFYRHPNRERPLEWLGLSGRRYFRSAVLGGGTLIGPGYVDTVDLAFEQGLPLWSFGTGVGSPGYGHADDIDLWPWRSLLPRFRSVSVRGPLSQHALEGIGYRGAEVIGDPGLGLAVAAPEPIAHPRMFAVNIALPPDVAYDQAFAGALRSLEPTLADLVRQGWIAAPYAMHARDVGPTTELVGRIGAPRCDVPVVATWTAFRRLIGGCALSVPVRLHGAVLACAAGVPPLMLGYRSKCADFMMSMDLERWHVDLANPACNDARGKLERLIGEAPGMREKVLDRARGWRCRQIDFLRRSVPDAVERQGVH